MFVAMDKNQNKKVINIETSTPFCITMEMCI